MGRKNRNPHPARRNDPADRYDVDYVYLSNAPDIAAVVVPHMKTVYKNLSCAPWADTMHVVKGEKDKYLSMIRKLY